MVPYHRNGVLTDSITTGPIKHLEDIYSSLCAIDKLRASALVKLPCVHQALLCRCTNKQVVTGMGVLLPCCFWAVEVQMTKDALYWVICIGLKPIVGSHHTPPYFIALDCFCPAELTISLVNRPGPVELSLEISRDCCLLR